MEKEELTTQELLFLDFLFDGDVIRHPNEAKVMAGYDKSYPVLNIIKKLNKELIQKCDNYLAMYSPHGIKGLMDILNNPNEPGSKVKLQAVIELLDRSGVVKKEKTEVQQQAPNYIFYLPPKETIQN